MDRAGPVIDRWRCRRLACGAPIRCRGRAEPGRCREKCPSDAGQPPFDRCIGLAPANAWCSRTAFGWQACHPRRPGRRHGVINVLRHDLPRRRATREHLYRGEGSYAFALPGRARVAVPAGTARRHRWCRRGVYWSPRSGPPSSRTPSVAASDICAASRLSLSDGWFPCSPKRSKALCCIFRRDVLTCSSTFIQARGRPVARAVEEWGNDMQATAAGTELLREETTDGSAHAASTPARLRRPRRRR